MMRNKLWAMVLLSMSFGLIGAENKTVIYDWLTLGKKSGELKVTYMEGGKQTGEFAFNDRGRGPKIVETIQLDQSGQVISFAVTGNSYMGSDVDESFSLKNGEAQWQSTDEQGQASITTPVAYVNSQGSTESLGVMVRYVMQQPNMTLKLLPSGQATVEELLSTTVKYDGLEKKVKLMALSGLGFTPSYLWLDNENQIFAVAYGWMGMTPAGWGEVLSKLQDLQDEAEQKFLKSRAQKLTENLPASVLINHVNVVDVKTGQLIKDSAIYIESGIIKAMGADAKGLKAASVIDGQGKTLIPGMWDMHVHVGLSDGLLHLANGVTSVRDMANTHDDLVKTITAFDQGEVMGPHVYKAGFIDQKSPFSAPTGQLAESLEQALAFVDWYAERGYPQIKIYSSITPAWVKPMAERIHQHGMKLSGHIPSFMTTEQAVKDGYDEIQHINMLFLNFLADDKDDTRTPVRFTLVGEEAGELDLDSKEVSDLIKLLKDNAVVVDPTVTIFHSMFLNRSGEIDPGYAAIADHLPTNVRRGFLGSELKITDENELMYQKSAAALLVMIKKLHEAGIQLVAGTDAMVGFTLHRELELYAKAGITNANVLKIATIDSAKVAGQDQKTGSIEVGKAADLVLLEGNPLEDISAVRKVVWSIKGDTKYSSAKLFKSIGVKPFTSED